MKRNRGEELLLASWKGPLAAGEAEELRGLLEADPELRRAARTWTLLGETERSDEMQIPSERMRQRLRGALDAVRAFEAGRPSAAGGGGEARRRLASAAALVAIGVAAGLLAAGWLGARSDLRAMRSELAAVRGEVVLSLLDHQEASERLRAVGWCRRGKLEGGVLEALVEAARHDPSVNVRLAAVDALSGSLDPTSRRRLAASLPDEASPLVQLRLVEALFTNGGAELDRDALLEPGVLDETVRHRLADLSGGDA
jgi:hypothetical protein